MGGWRAGDPDDGDDAPDDGDAFGTGAGEGWMTPRTPVDLFRRDALAEAQTEARVWTQIEAALWRAEHRALCRASAERTWDAICADWRRSRHSS